LPTFYQGLPAGATISANQLVVSGFPSWLGQANPGGAFGQNFANELGNRLHFGLAVVASPGTTFSLSQLSFSMASTDPGNTFQFSGDFSDPNDPTNVYSSARVGVRSDGTLVTSGPATQLVSALYYVGVGNAIAPDDIGATGTDQEQLDQVLGFIEGLEPFQINVTYTLTTDAGTFTGTSFVNVGEADQLGDLLQRSHGREPWSTQYAFAGHICQRAFNGAAAVRPRRQSGGASRGCRVRSLGRAVAG